MVVTPLTVLLQVVSRGLVRIYQQLVEVQVGVIMVAVVPPEVQVVFEEVVFQVGEAYLVSAV
jgi:hypothetical protein